MAHIPVLLVVALCLTGCAGIIVVPESAPEAAQRPVFMVEHGRHTSLVLTLADASMVRYAYGDWRWYAKRETGFLRAFPTLFARTQGTLGRQVMAGPPHSDGVRGQLNVRVDAIHRFDAPTNRIDALVTELEAAFHGALDQIHESRVFALDFVPYSKPYIVGDNSNHVIARWLDALGFEVRGNPALGRWRVERPLGNAESICVSRGAHGWGKAA